MPRINDYAETQPLDCAHLDTTLRRLKKAIYTRISPLTTVAYCSREPLSFDNRLEGTRTPVSVGERWGGFLDCAWFHISGHIPPECRGAKVVALVDLNGEGALYDSHGTPVQGLTSTTCAFFREFGDPDKRVIALADCAEGSEPVDLWIDAGCVEMSGQNHGTLAETAICTVDRDCRTLMYDFEVMLSFVNIAPADTARTRRCRRALLCASQALGTITEASVEEARRILAPCLAARNGDAALEISAIGNAHIDLLWLWPQREAVRKGIRTFATAIHLMDKYPAYLFGASQPQLYEWVKEGAPQLFEKVRSRVREGRWDIHGALWVESDCNCISGESIARQLLYGKRFFRKEFGVNVRTAWLPDTFGFPGSLPQLLKKAGCDYFVTQKMHWNNITRHPHQTFWWEGIDRSRVLTHFLPEENYCSPVLPKSFFRVEKTYRDSDVCADALVLFGIGDGGGGPGEEHCERLQRCTNFQGVPPVVQRSSTEFFARVEKAADKLATWQGELYLERHQGTFTTRARSKSCNRRMQIALHDLEVLASWAEIATGRPYPARMLEAFWKETLLYQFHDAITGTSIQRVYDEMWARYDSMLGTLETQTVATCESLLNGVTTRTQGTPALINCTPWSRNEWRNDGGEWYQVTLLSHSLTLPRQRVNVLRPEDIFADENRIENDLIRVIFDRDGAIRSIFDKEAARELLRDGCRANEFLVYSDEGDPWDFRMDYRDTRPARLTLKSRTHHVHGPYATIEQEFAMGDSTLTQKVIITQGSRRIDFTTDINWQEHSTMLRTGFPVDVAADRATCGIPFGAIERPVGGNTDRDLACDEIPASNWIDFSESTYGVAVLCSDKYGYSVKNRSLDINLLRNVRIHHLDQSATSGQARPLYTDAGRHQTSYALFPHAGDRVAGGVVREAGIFATRPLECRTSLEPDSELVNRSFVAGSTESVVIDTIKRAEEGPGYCVRLYECNGSPATTRITAFKPIRSLVETTLIEDDIRELPVEPDGCTLELGPYEIRTVRVIF